MKYMQLSLFSGFQRKAMIQLSKFTPPERFDLPLLNQAYKPILSPHVKFIIFYNYFKTYCLKSNLNNNNNLLTWINQVFRS